MLNNLPLILLVGENLLLLIALIIWLNRKCQKCQQVKCVECIFSRLCRKCDKCVNIPKDKPKKPTPNKEQIEIF